MLNRISSYARAHQQLHELKIPHDCEQWTRAEELEKVMRNPMDWPVYMPVLGYWN